MTALPDAWTCNACDGPLIFERCADWTDTGHPVLTAMWCLRCGARYEATCPACVDSKATSRG